MAEFFDEEVLPKKRQKLDINEADECLKDELIGREDVNDTATANKNDEKPGITDISSDIRVQEHPRVETQDTIKSISSGRLIEEGASKGVTETGSYIVHRTEREVGISEYISSHGGFSGTLKQRYSDFVVNERDLEGRTVHLSTTDLPAEFIKEKLESAVLSSEALQKLEDLVKSEDKTLKVVVEVEDDKEKRTLIHREIREKFPTLESDTAEMDEHKVVRAFHHVPNDKKRRRKPDWPKERGEYCHFSLYKENKDTMQAINLLAKCLKVKPDRFAYAGTKDGRAVTVQRVSVFRVNAKNLQGLNKVLNNICLGNFEFRKTPLKLGDLTGNTFVIVLRNVTGGKDQVEAAMKSIKDTGFINYFGLQRFGSSVNATHSIGLCLLKSQWSEAVDLILGFRPGHDSKLIKACQHWRETKDAREALKILDGKKCLESFLLEGLAKFGNKDFLASLKLIPRNTRLMYVHAYQSYIWNSVVSRRITEFGLKPVVGDLVFKDKLGRTSTVGATDDTELSENQETILHTNKVAVKALTEDDLQRGSYSIHDVIMPLPGYDVEYPRHEAKAWYETLLAADGLDINNMRHKVKDFSLSGTYRQMIVQPRNVQWKMFRYNDTTIPLVLTDLGRLRGDAEPVSEADGKYEALRIELGLPSSSYATMAVREILKTETSPSFHSSLNEH